MRQDRITRRFIPAWIIILVISLSQLSCKKFLDEKTNKKLVIPSTLSDAQALMDHYTAMNGNYSNLGLESDDNFYLLQTYYNTLVVVKKDHYIWAPGALAETDWRNMYIMVMSANIALEIIEKQSPEVQDATATKYIKGAACFFRAVGLYHNVQYYARPYDASTAGSLPGIPLRLSSDATPLSVRGTLEQTWQQILRDLRASVSLLPEINAPLTRPSQTAAHAMLARVCLDMGKYEEAGRYADSALRLKNTLINFNTLSAATAFPFVRYNPETILLQTAQSTASLNATNYRVDSTLYISYSNNDLRKSLYFKSNGTNTYSFRGGYDGTITPFSGLATDEVYLIKAEAAARVGQKDTALTYLNRLLQTRFVTNTYVPFTAATAQDALLIILTERRKELIMRDRRWFDLRRLNKDPLTAKILKRIENGITYTLPPNDNRYTFLIPADVIGVTGMEQNTR